MKRARSRSHSEEVEQTAAEVTKKVLTLQPYKKANFDKYDFKLEKPLNRQFFRQEVVELSKQLLGKVLIRETPQGLIRAIIVETEAYKAPLDKACHAHNNKKTERTKYFWLDGGHLYLYTIYMPTNVCMNVVAGLENQPEAVLIRAVQPIDGIDIIKAMRKSQAKTSVKLQEMCNGPAKVGKSLDIKMHMNGISLLEGEFRIVDAGIQGFKMGVSRRINIDYAEEWVHTPWRFFVEGNTFVSKLPPLKADKNSK